jgi:poly-gamma-glutamate capsule biosynthesis protein CapA/YwtB (metallophosphatase superfamily)
MRHFRLIPLLLVFIVSACQPQNAVVAPLPTNLPQILLQTPTRLPSPQPPTPSATAIQPSAMPSLTSPLPSSVPPTETVTPADDPLTTLLFTGVIVPARCVQAAIDERDDTDYPYDEVRDIISSADLAIGTLNATISDYPPHTGCVPTYVLVGGSGNADALQRAGFDVMSVATNHIKNCGLMNCGDRAFFDTLDNLRRVNIIPVGAGANHAEAMQPVVVSVDGVRYGIVSLGQIEPMAFAGEGTPGIAVLNPENLRAAIQAARQVSDVVIAMPHWGPEDVPWPNAIQRDLAKQLVEAGADIVVGNHTHVVQAVEEIDGVPVFYGLGNFVFDQGLPDHKQGVILKLSFKEGRYSGFDLIPTHVDKDGTVHIAGPQEAAEVLERTRQASLPLGMGWWTPEYVSSLPKAELEGLSQEEVARRLFEQWMEYGAAPALPNAQRIFDYEIEGLKVNEEQQARAVELGVDYIAEVTFSVRPIVPQFSSWVAGNGELKLDGWVRQKSLFVGVRDEGERYRMVVLGTGL